MIGRRVKQIGDIVLEHPLWVSIAEDMSARHDTKLYHTVFGNVIQYVRKRSNIPFTLEAKNNEWISEDEKQQIEALYMSMQEFNIIDDNDTTHRAIFDYENSIQFTPVVLGATYYYPELNLILIEEN